MRCLWLIFLVAGMVGTVEATETPDFNDTLEITKENHDHVVTLYDILFIVFETEWCHFSMQLRPIWEAAWNVVRRKELSYPKVVMGRVNCENNTLICTKYSVSKYPTMKLVKFGQILKREYRGARTVDGIVEFVFSETIPEIVEEKSADYSESSWSTKVALISYANTKGGGEAFVRLAITLRGECLFVRGDSNVARQRGIEDTIGVRVPGKPPENQIFYPNGEATDFRAVLNWAAGFCVPPIREISFETAEALVDEGRPLLLLFRNPEDMVSLRDMERFTEKHLPETLRSEFTFVTANCLLFTHPLSHLNKTTEDCPILVIDSFRHMYQFPHFELLLSNPKILSDWLADFLAGGLHRDFHRLPRDKNMPRPSTPKPSVFIHLGPNHNRYSFPARKDEL